MSNYPTYSSPLDSLSVSASSHKYYTGSYAELISPVYAWWYTIIINQRNLTIGLLINDYDMAETIVYTPSTLL